MKTAYLSKSGGPGASPAPSLFNKSGRRIPPPNLTVAEANNSFSLQHPRDRYCSQRLCRFNGTGLEPGVFTADFDSRVDELIERLRQDNRLRGIFSGVFLPIMVPQMQVEDCGQTAEQLVTTAGQAYVREFIGREFTNHRQGELAGDVTIVPESRHQELVDQIARASVAGIYFPIALQGFSVGAQRAQMSSLPKGFLLSGVIDSAMALLMYPDILGQDGKSPFGPCSAVRWGQGQDDEECSLAFLMADDHAVFGFAQCLHRSDAARSGGLLYIGDD